MHRHTYDDKTSRQVLQKLFTLFEVLDTAGMNCRRALLSSVSDYEDAVMNETAILCEVDCIVTRNIPDYAKSSIPVYTPDAFIEIISEDEE